jgi:acetylornithine deacetylase/succinyl-diaminopimelate desuccinylase-like protein
VVKAAEIVAALAAKQLPKEADSDFAFGPKLTVTAINGGKSFAAVPDKCTITVDTRLTPSFTKDSAAALIAETVAQIDSVRVTTKPTAIRAKESWPPYKLDRELPLLKALQEAAGKEHGKAIKLKVVGPLQHRQLPCWSRHSGNLRLLESTTRTSTPPMNVSKLPASKRLTASTSMP